jgi:hypothetical protein
MRVEASGQPVIEASFFGIRNIVALTDSLGDAFLDGATSGSASQRGLREVLPTMGAACA